MYHSVTAVWTSEDSLFPVVSAASFGTYALYGSDRSSRFHLRFLAHGASFSENIQWNAPHHRLWGSALQTFVDDGCATAEELNGVSP